MYRAFYMLELGAWVPEQSLALHKAPGPCPRGTQDTGSGSALVTVPYADY